MLNQTADSRRLEQIEHEFGCHVPKPDDSEHYAAINDAAKAFAKVVIQHVPWSVDRDHAVQAIREAALRAKDALLVYNPTDLTKPISINAGHKVRLLENSVDLGRQIITMLEQKSSE